MAAVNNELREVDDLNDNMNGQIDRRYSSNNCLIVKLDGEDHANTVVADDDVPQSCVANETGDGSDQQQQHLGEVVESFDNEFYQDGSGFFPYGCGFYVDPSGLYYPYNNCQSYVDNGTTYYNVESVSTGSGGGSVQDLPKKQNRAIDIIDPVTGEKLKFF